MISKFHLPTQSESVDKRSVVSSDHHDKKTRGNQLKIILLEKIGQAKIVTIPTEEIKIIYKKERKRRMMRYITAGEPHGPELTAIIEGLPAGLPLTAADINHELARRQTGYGRGGRMLIEKDQVRITPASDMENIRVACDIGCGK